MDDASLSCRSRLVAALRVALVALALFAAGAGPAPAETPPTPADTGVEDGAAVTVEDLDSLVSTIEDEARRKALVAQLKALIAAQRAQDGDAAERETGMAGALAALADRVRAAGADVVETVTMVLDVPLLWRWLSATAVQRS